MAFKLIQIAQDRWRRLNGSHLLPLVRVGIRTVLSDNGREFCGRAGQHPYELFLQLEDIEHRATQVRRPQSNGFIERFHRTLFEEHFRVKGRTTWYETVEEIQADLEAYLEIYNTRRPHRGRGMNVRAPAQVFKAGIKLAKKAAKTTPTQEEKTQPRPRSGEDRVSADYRSCTA